MYNATWWGSFGWQLLFLPTSWNLALAALFALMLVGMPPALWRSAARAGSRRCSGCFAAGLLVFAVTEFRRQLSPQPGRDHARYWLPAIAPIWLMLWLGLVDLSKPPAPPLLPPTAIAGDGRAVPSPSRSWSSRPNFPEPVPVRPSIARWSFAAPGPGRVRPAAPPGRLRRAGLGPPRRGARAPLYWEMLAPTRSTTPSSSTWSTRPGRSRPRPTARSGRSSTARPSCSPARPSARSIPSRCRRRCRPAATPSSSASTRRRHRSSDFRSSRKGWASHRTRSGSPPSRWPVRRTRASRRVGRLRWRPQAGRRRFPAVARSGAPLEVDLEWQSLAPVDRDYKLFVHLVDAAGRPRAQSDEPLEIAGYPVARWQPGETAPDPPHASGSAAASGPRRIPAAGRPLRPGRREPPPAHRERRRSDHRRRGRARPGDRQVSASPGHRTCRWSSRPTTKLADSARRCRPRSASCRATRSTRSWSWSTTAARTAPPSWPTGCSPRLRRPGTSTPASSPTGRTPARGTRSAPASSRPAAASSPSPTPISRPRSTRSTGRCPTSTHQTASRAATTWSSARARSPAPGSSATSRSTGG